MSHLTFVLSGLLDIKLQRTAVELLFYLGPRYVLHSLHFGLLTPLGCLQRLSDVDRNHKVRLLSLEVFCRFRHVDRDNIFVLKWKLLFESQNSILYLFDCQNFANIRPLIIVLNEHWLDEVSYPPRILCRYLGILLVENRVNEVFEGFRPKWLGTTA